MSTYISLPAICPCGIGINIVLARLKRMSQLRSIAAAAPVIVVLAIVTLLPPGASAGGHRYQSDPEGSYYTEALNILYANGWHNVSNLERTGDVVHAVALGQNGQQAPVTVDLKSRTVLAD
jgi:hypothetical protein